MCALGVNFEGYLGDLEYIEQPKCNHQTYGQINLTLKIFFLRKNCLNEHTTQIWQNLPDFLA